MRSGWALWAIAVAMVLVSCKKDGVPGSCVRARDNTCAEYGAAEAAAGARMCLPGIYRPGEKCAPEGRLGTCAREGGKIAEYMYSGPPNGFTLDAAKAACEAAGGTFR